MVGTSEGLEDPAAVKNVSAWVTLLLRTIKTCRLYDPGNPAVTRFRQELVDATGSLLDQCGTLRLEIQSSSLLFQGHPVFQTSSRDDNLPGVLHRDGLRAITLLPGIAPDEIQGFVDVILQVTGPAPGDDDLVTLLWEANLPHVEVSAVPLEGDVDGGDESDGEISLTMPWPESGGAAASPASGVDKRFDPGTRSDDWKSVDGIADPEAVFEELVAAAEANCARFGEEHRSAHEVPLVAAVAEILADALASGATAADRTEVGRFVPRLLREAIGQGEWRAAAAALHMLHEAVPNTPLDTFLEGIAAHPSPVTRHAVAALDRQSDEALGEFREFAEALGAPAVTWLMHILADSQQKRVRQQLLPVIAELARERPEVLLDWLDDERWYVVRNVVHIFSRIEGDAMGGLVKAVARHPEPRVQREVLAVLARTDQDTARPLLIGMLEMAEPRLYAAVLQQLAQDPDEAIIGVLLAAFAHDAFSRRTEQEQRAVLMALAGRGDAVLPALDAELNRGGFFSRGDDSQRQAIALCIARIGTPAAREALERAAKMGKPGVRKACSIALASKGAPNG
jgi:HEAT repeat protein